MLIRKFNCLEELDVVQNAKLYVSCVCMGEKGKGENCLNYQ